MLVKSAKVPGTLVVFSGSGLGVLFIWALQMYIKDILNKEDVLIKPVFPKEHMVFNNCKEK